MVFLECQTNLAFGKSGVSVLPAFAEVISAVSFAGPWLN